MSFTEPLSFRIKIFVLKNSFYLLLLFVLFSPLIVWHIAHFNLFLLQTFAIRQSTLLASTFVTSTMVGLITLFGVSLTILWNYYMRQRELATQRVYLVDKILEELNVNNKKAKLYLNLKVNNKRAKFIPSFSIKHWFDIAENATLLNRDLYTPISIIYKRLKENKISGSELAQVQLMMEDIIEKLYMYRKELRTLYEVRMSKEDKQIKREFEKAYKQSCNVIVKK